MEDAAGGLTTRGSRNPDQPGVEDKMQTDVNGCSTCPVGMESYEFFRRGKSSPWLVQYDYRTEAGELFSCIGRGDDRTQDGALANARAKRDKWLIAKAES